MNKWEPLHWQGHEYIIVPNPNPDRGSCSQCHFNEKEPCPKNETGLRRMSCLHYERVTGKEAYIIRNSPDDVAKYIADLLSS